MDPVANFPYSFIEIPPDPGVSGTDAKLRGGGASVMPKAGDFQLVIWKAGVIATKSVSEITRCSMITETMIAAGSDGVDLPQAIIHLDDATGFSSDGGTTGIELTDGTTAVVTYTGTTGTTLTGCTGGVGTMHTNDRATDDWIVIERGTEETTPIVIKKGMQVLAALTKLWFDSLVGGVPTSYLHQVFVNIPGVGAMLFGNEAAADVSNDNTFLDTFNPPPATIAALDYLPFPTSAVENVPLDDDYDLDGRMHVSNLDGTEQIVIECTGIINEGDGSGSLDWSTAEVQGTPVGSDLSFDPDNGIQSTAGGVFNVWYYFKGERD